MEPLSTRWRIAILILAITCTVILLFLAEGGMHWVFGFVGSFGLTTPSPQFRLIGGIFLAVVVLLRFYFRWSARKKRSKK